MKTEMSGQKNVRGQPAYIPNDADRNIVKNGVTACVALPILAAIIGVSDRTLQRHYKKDMEGAMAGFRMNVSAALYKKAIDPKSGMAGVTAAIWLEKMRGGLRETSVVEHAGADGGALPDRGNVVIMIPDNGRDPLPLPKGRAPKMIDATPVKSKESDDD